MVVITFSRLRRYVLANPGCRIGLYHWARNTERADWACFADVKRSFPSVDYVGNDRFVFDIHGNRYRLIVMIHFPIRSVYIRFIGTHAEYDKITDIINL